MQSAADTRDHVQVRTHLHPLLSIVFGSLSSPAAHFVSLKKVPTSHLSVLDTFLILSPLLTPPHRRVRTQTHGAGSVEEDEF